MTCRRCTVLEQGACEQLRLHGYEVRIHSPVKDQRCPPAHLAATKKSGETRSIRIYKISARLANIYRLEECFGPVILRYLTEMARHPDPLIRYEIWLYLVHPGYRCFVILPDRVRQIPQMRNLPVHILVEEAP